MNLRVRERWPSLTDRARWQGHSFRAARRALKAGRHPVQGARKSAFPETHRLLPGEPGASGGGAYRGAVRRRRITGRAFILGGVIGANPRSLMGTTLRAPKAPVYGTFVLCAPHIASVARVGAPIRDPDP